MSTNTNTDMNLSVHAKANGFGAAVTGVDLSKPLAPEVASAITEACARHGVLWCPGQVLDPVSLAALSRSLGHFGIDPYVAPLAEHPNVIKVCREPEETAPIFGSFWHSDWSFQTEPPSSTLLYGKEVPPIGGDTLFADGYRAYEALSNTMKNVVGRLSAVHSASPAYGPRGLFSKDDETRSMAIIVSEDAEQTCVHPIVRRHPVSGRVALYINHVYTLGIEGMHAAESTALLEFLFEHMTRPEFVYRHRWQPDMLVMWDNRCVIHMADGGYEGHRRLMYRTTLAGETPLAA